ncbi:MAG: aminopeptidase, partial [Patescibacteria group bacterium]
MDRLQALAKVLVGYSTRVQPGDKVLIEAIGVRTFPMVEVLMAEIRKAGGIPFYLLHDEMVKRANLHGATETELALEGDFQKARMEQMDCWIGIRGNENPFELADVPADVKALASEHIMKKVHLDVRVPKTRWVLLRWPSFNFAQSAQMPTRVFEQFFFDACCADYEAMSLAMDPLVALMSKTDKVHIVAPGTDITFSIKDIPVVKCDGKMNIPDGEVFTAPVRDSVNGGIKYNTPTLFEGKVYDGITFVFESGRIVKATCEVGSEVLLNEILDRDEGARFIGEFAIGVNLFVTQPMLDTLFDEKIAGSIHFTPGNAYEGMADNGNRSKIHWDLVLRQDPENGGGEVWFDDVLVRKDGKFV